MKRKLIALTLGDPGGVGPEVIARTLTAKRLDPRFSYVLLGIPGPFKALEKKYGLKLSFVPVTDFKSFSFRSGKLHFFDVSRAAGVSGFDPAKVSRRNAAAAYTAVSIAAREAASGQVAAIVTAPVNKTSMRLLDRGFHGHTELLAETAGVKKFAMAFVSPRLKVTLTTIHVALKKVHTLIRKKNVLEKIELTHEFLKSRCGIARPKLGVCALNPHGRETGTEDEKEIRPAVAEARRKKIDASGPHSADQLFFDAYEGRYDAVISMYHDQALAPFKMIAFRDGVNVTLGLPFVRTSPDHGTAFDIAYKRKADPVSFKAALELAEKLLR